MPPLFHAVHELEVPSCSENAKSDSTSRWTPSIPRRSSHVTFICYAAARRLPRSPLGLRARPHRVIASPEGTRNVPLGDAPGDKWIASLAMTPNQQPQGALAMRRRL